MSSIHSPQGTTKSSAPAGAAALAGAAANPEKPSLKKPPDPSLIKQITSGIKKKTYNLAKINEVLATLSKQLIQYKVLPLPENFARELSHGVDLDSVY